MIELLSPAGSMEALRAAVQNGANAVYLGYDQFNARMNAKNFSADELQEAIVYCHVRGVAVHLTLNTLVADREMARAADVIRLAATLGVDAFIVQDIGMSALPGDRAKRGRPCLDADVHSFARGRGRGGGAGMQPRGALAGAAARGDRCHLPQKPD